MANGKKGAGAKAGLPSFSTPAKGKGGSVPVKVAHGKGGAKSKGKC